MKTTWICIGLVLNSLLLFIGLLSNSEEWLLPAIFFSIEIVLIVLLFWNLFTERRTELSKWQS